MSQPDGWLTDIEAAELRRLAKDRSVLELGAWKGRSTVVLAESAEYVVSVDRHGGIRGHGGDSLPDYLENVRHIRNVAIVVAHFDEIAPRLGEFDMVYIDGDHDADAVAADTLLIPDLLSPGGVVAYHDWDIAEVQDTVVETVGRQPDGVVGSVAYYLDSR